MSEIPERAFVIAERMKTRQNSEAEIREALAGFELSEKQIKEVLKQSGEASPYIGESEAQGRAYDNGIRSSPSRIGVSPALTKHLAGKFSIMDEIKDTLASFAIRFFLIILVFALLFACGYSNILYKA